MKKPSLQPCARWADQLAVALDDLAPAERAALEVHLLSCQACAAVFAEYRQLDERILAVSSPAPLAGLPPRLVQLWREEEQAGHPRPGVRLRGLRLMEDEMRTSEAQHTGGPAATSGTLHARARRRVVSALSVVAAVLAITLIMAGLLASRSPKTSTVGNPEPTARREQGWSALPNLTSLPGVPVIAPSNPQVVYESVRDNQPQLQRSDDAGATWQSLPLPAGAPQGNGAVALLFVNPLNAQQVYLEINTCPTAQASSIGPAVVLSSGEGCTTFDYVSTDAGTHWQQAQWPVSANDLHKTRLGGIYAYPAFQVQGTRLYALLSVGDGVGSILVTSTDGVSWQPADQPLRAQANCATGFAPTPTGSTVFAITTDQCTGGSSLALTSTSGMSSLALPLAGGGGNFLWRSDDAGAHWSKVGGILAGINLRAFHLAGFSQPVLYDDGFLSSENILSPATIKVSVDGGHTWQSAPTAPAAPLYSDDAGILATFSDGSIVGEFGGAFYAWRVGQAAWQKVAPEIFEAPKVGAGPVMHLFITQGAGEKGTFWAVIAKNSGYIVYTYQQKSSAFQQ
jgi:anti-sigma factor RsiW